jgi:RNA-directed DNA polymerase
MNVDKLTYPGLIVNKSGVSRTMPKADQLWDEWRDIDWKAVESRVWKLQKQIYRASMAGDSVTIHTLQKRLLRSYFAKLLAVRKVSQENQGKRTAGVDGVKALTPKARFQLASRLDIKHKPSPIRRVYIPKPGKAEKRPLGIPTMYDRVCQCLVKLALEPEWEAKFHPESYGFRPGRSAHDAIEAIRLSIEDKGRKTRDMERKDHWIFESDIEKCFDRINHDYLLEKLQTFPRMRRSIKGWLKAGCLQEDRLFPTEEGTPQGGAVSPLLANIALHGIEEAHTVKRKKGTATLVQQKLIRYADDFLIIFGRGETPKNIGEIIGEINATLAPIGLRLKESKTRLVKSSEGIDFVGFNVKKYPCQGAWKTLVKPSKEAQLRHYARLKEIVKKHGQAPQSKLIAELNPIIRGWSNYYRTANAKKAFSLTDHKLFQSLWGWATSRCKHTAKGKIKTKYWNNWRFTDGKYLLNRHSDTKIDRHIKVNGMKSPFDGDHVYWAVRLSKYSGLPSRIQKILKAQNGKCNWCQRPVLMGDQMEIDHIIPKSLGGADLYNNLQLLHQHCHDSKTAKDVVDYTTINSGAV